MIKVKTGLACRGLIILICTVLLAGPIFAAKAQAALFGSFTIREEIELGRKFEILIKSRMPLIEDPEITGYIADLVKKLSEAMPPQPFPLRSFVIQNNAINAFAVPGGMIFVHTGLILNFKHESELVGIIAHELAHVSKRHIASRIEKMQWVSLLSALGMVAGLFLGGDGAEAAMAGSIAASQMAMLKYSRDDEREADQVGFNYLTKAGFKADGLMRGLDIIRKNRWMGGSTMPTYMSTHPDVADRVSDMESRIRHLPDVDLTKTEDDTRFLKIQTLLRGRYADVDQAARYYAMPANNSCLDHLGRAMVLERSNKLMDSDSEFVQALACNPEEPLVLREAGRFYLNKGDPVRADLLLQQSIKLNRDDLLTQFLHGRALDQTGHKAEAAAIYRKILEKLPEDSEVRYHYGRVMGETNNLFEAHLNLAYSAMYVNNRRQTEFHMNRAKEFLSKDPGNTQKFEDFEKIYQERKEFWL